MTPRNYLNIAVGITVLLIVLFTAVIPNIQDAVNIKNTASVINETFQGEYDTPIQLAHADIVPDSETVYNSTTTFVKGVDYNIDYTNGTITILSTGSMLNNTPYSIDYEYYYPVYTGTTKTILQLVPLMLALGALVAVWFFFRDWL